MANTNEIQAALTAYYRSKQNNNRSIQIKEVANVGGGNQREMYFFSAVKQRQNSIHSQSLLLRLYDGTNAAYDARYEFEVISKLGQSTIPVPEVFVLETDTEYLGKPFIIMERIRGEDMLTYILRSINLESADLSVQYFMPWISKLAKLLAEIHSLDWQGLGLGFMDKAEGKYNLIDDLFRWPFIKNPALKYPKFKELCDWLLVRSEEVSCMEPVLLHVDFHPGNILVDNDRILAVIDWAESRIGDATVDVAWESRILCKSGVPGLDKAFIEEYRRISGRKLENLEFYEVMAGIRELGEYLTLKDGKAIDISKRPDAEIYIPVQSDYILERTGIDVSSLSE